MKLSADKLAAHLDKGLARAYLITGDDPLLVSEVSDAIRACARQKGFTDRELHVARPGFDWNQLAASHANLSLFAQRRIVEIRLPTGKPGRDGAAAITGYMADPPDDNLFLLVCPKLDRSAASSAWATARATVAPNSEVRDASTYGVLRLVLRPGGYDWQFVSYGGAVHSFTKPAAGNDNSKGAAYNEAADKKSWEEMKQFFGKIFAKK